MSEIQHINRNSDFSILVRFTKNGEITEVPSHPWRLVFTTDTTHSFIRYIADFDGENFHHCHRASDSEVLVIFENHRLGPGILQMTFEVDIPSVIYQDGVLNAEIPSLTQIELWDKASDAEILSAHVEAAIAYLIHGKGVPPGGTSGQVLKKNSDEDFDTTWGDDEGITEIAPGAVKRENLSKEVIDEIDSKPGYIVPATGGAQIAEVFNAAKENDDGELPGEHSHAEGINTFARGQGSHAEGMQTKTTAMGAHAEGTGSVASGNNAHAEGWNTKASGETSHAEGLHCEASGYSAHAEGQSTRASYDCDHAEGYGTRASGGYTHAEGKNTQATGTCSHSEGNGTVASGANSHAEGDGSQAKALDSHAEGEESIVESSAKSGHAGGKSSIVESEAGFAHGVNAVSKNRGEAVFGKNNEPDTTGKSVFQVGIGMNKSHPKTGFQIDSDGTIWIINTTTGNRISLQSWLNDIQLKKEVVDALPETGDSFTVYLLRVTTPDDEKHNYFEEYIYLNGAWELLGTSDTDETLVERILNNSSFAEVLAGKASQEQFAEIQQIATRANSRADEAYARGDQAYAHAATALSNVQATDSRVTGLEYALNNEATTRANQDANIRYEYTKKFDEAYDKIADVQRSLTTYVDETRDLILPRSRFVNGSIVPDGPFNVPEGMGLPWIGVMTYMHGRWKLTRAIGCCESEDPTTALICDSIRNVVRSKGWTIQRADSKGQCSINLLDLFDSEFISLEELYDGSPITYYHAETPKRMQVGRLRLFTRDKRNIGNLHEKGSDMLPSGHNPIGVSVWQGGDYFPFKFDITRKGNKQVIRRRYKIGYVWPQGYNADGTPQWGHEYISSNWTTVQVERIVYLYPGTKEADRPKYSIKVL